MERSLFTRMRVNAWRTKLALVLVGLLMLSLCTACGAKGKNQDPTKITGEIFDAGNVSAMAPKGWKAFPVSDVFDAYEGDNNPNSIYLCKGAKNEFDLFSKPLVTITYYGPDTIYYSAKSLFEDAKDIEGFTLGDYDWTGYEYASFEDAKTIMVETVKDDITITACFLTKTGNQTLSLEDPDIQAILANIKVTE